MSERYLTRVKAAEYLMMPVSTFDHLVRKGVLPPARALTERIIRWDKSELDAVMAHAPTKNELKQIEEELNNE